MRSAIGSKNYATFLYKYKDLSWGRGVLPYLGMVGRFYGDDTCFCDCQSDLVPYFTPSSLSPQFVPHLRLNLIHGLQDWVKVLYQYLVFYIAKS